MSVCQECGHVGPVKGVDMWVLSRVWTCGFCQGCGHVGPVKGVDMWVLSRVWTCGSCQGCGHVGSVKQTESYRCRHPCIHGSGHQNHGYASTLIIQIHSLKGHSLLYLMLTPKLLEVTSVVSPLSQQSVQC